MEINEDTSYLIGLFQSDGNLYQMSRNRGRAVIEISKKDEDIIYKIKELITYNYTIKERRRKIKIKKYNYDNVSISISIYNKYFRQFLNINGVPYGKKSKIIEYPKSTFLSKIDYIRGLFDGDGSLGFTKNNFPFVSFVTESEDIKNYLLTFFSEITNKEKKEVNRNKRDNLYNIMISKEDAIKFCKIVYYDNCLSINRKYEISKDIINWIRPKDMKKIEFRKKWSKNEDDFINNHTIEESIIELSRTKKSIEMRKIRLNNNFLY